jgi:hypothetical protein
VGVTAGTARRRPPVTEAALLRVQAPASKTRFQIETTTINHTYRASSNNTVYWASRITAGVLIWSSSARATSWISLQETAHAFNVSYTSLGSGRLSTSGCACANISPRGPTALQDGSAGRSFAVGGNIRYPRFQCYVTVSCKYPNGVEAPW